MVFRSRSVGGALVVAAALTAARARGEDARPAREPYAVQAFGDASKKAGKAFAHLEAGLPAFLAERLAQVPPLRFVGGPGLIGAPPAARWIVEGSFERQPDWRLKVRVKVHGAAPDAPSAEAERIGPKDAAPRLALDAAWEAFGSVGVKLPAPADAVVAPFGRDPYAFVLYGRGVASYLGLGGMGKSEDRAVEALKRSLLIDPKVPETRRYLGYVHLQGNRPGHARAMWTYALDVKPNYALVLGALAALDRASGLPAARERYARLLELDPDDTEARRAHGELLSEAGMLPEAQAELEKVVAIAPGDLRARRALALVLAARREGTELASELEQVVRLDPDDLAARMDLGAAYASLRRSADAEAVYDEVLRRKPRLPPALKLAGDLARARGDVKKAATLYGRLRAVSPQDPRPVFLLGTAHYEAGNLDLAERFFTEGSRYPGMMGEAYSNLGAIALKRGKEKEALWLLSRAAKKRPGKANVRFNYALALFKASQHADALNELRTAAVLDPNDAGVRFFCGVVALRLGLLQEAEQDFREALRLDPKNEDARHNLSLLEPLVKPKGEDSAALIAPPAPADDNKR